MANEPYMPLYFGDFLASTPELSGEAASLYLTLLGYQWSLGSLPKDPAALQKLCKWEITELFGQLWPVIARKFVERDGRLINIRLEQHRRKQKALMDARSRGGKKGMATRWGTDNSVTVELITPNQSNLKNKKPPTPIDNSLNNSVITEIKPKRTDKACQPNPASGTMAPQFVLPEGLNPDAWHEWTNYRKSIGKRIKPSAMQRAAETMMKLGDKAAQATAVAHSIGQGYQGLFPPSATLTTRKTSMSAELDAQAMLRAMVTLKERATLVGFRMPNEGETVDDYRHRVVRAENEHRESIYLAGLAKRKAEGS